ncbi:MAG: tetratricopeptide repeat protein [Caulobacteraceae bacterium]
MFAAALLLSGAAAAQAAPLRGPQGLERKGSSYGAFLAGQAALVAGDAATAQAYFAQARTARPDVAVIGERAFLAAVLAGDIPRAAEIAPRGGSPAIRSLGELVKGVELLAQNRGRQAYTVLSAQVGVEPGREQAGMLLRPWAAAAAGDWRNATAIPDSKDRLFMAVAQLDQAMIFERFGRYGEAENSFRALLSDKRTLGLVAPAYGVFLERRSRRDDAVKFYDELLADDPGNAPLAAARERAASGGKPPAMLTPQQGAAQALTAPAATMLTARQTDSALILMRLILRLDPQRDDALLLLADVQSRGEDKTAARATLARIPDTSPNYLAAQIRIAASYEDQPDQALALVRKAVAAKPEEVGAQLALAEALRASERYDEAVSVLNAVIEKEGARADWRLYYMRGAVLESAGRWPQAEADLNRALALKPDEPELLNFMGYAWVDQGVKVREGMAMIERAVQAEPNNGAYIDSLGWALYRLGRYPEAVEKLEQAALLMPSDAEVNDHLADAYWKAGRKDEARFRWRSVLTLDPPQNIRARTMAKLASPAGPDARVMAADTAAK